MSVTLATPTLGNSPRGLTGRRALVLDRFQGSNSTMVRPEFGRGIWGVNATWVQSAGSLRCSVNAGAPTNNNFIWTDTGVNNNFLLSARFNFSGTDLDRGFGFCFLVQDQFNNIRVTLHDSGTFGKLRLRISDVITDLSDFGIYSNYQTGDIVSLSFINQTYTLFRNGVQNSDAYNFEGEGNDISALLGNTRAGITSNFDLVSTCAEFSVETLL